MTEIKTLSKSDFDPHLNTTFKIHTDTVGIAEAELVEITEKKYENQESFSLIFSTPKDMVFEQKVYKIEHPQMDEMDLFLVPIASTQKDQMHYQAVFSRLLDK